MLQHINKLFMDVGEVVILVGSKLRRLEEIVRRLKRGRQENSIELQEF